MNKKCFMILAVFIVLCIPPLFSTACAEKTNSGIDRTFIFPLSLEIIEDEAFEGSAVETVVFPDGLLSIGSRAFGNAYFLTDVYIPDTTTYIADSAFFVTPNLTIHGLDGSYAMDWANSHKISFVVDHVRNTIVQSRRQHNTRTDPMNRFIVLPVLLILFEFFRLGYYELRSRRPQDRPELNPIDYRFP